MQKYILINLLKTKKNKYENKVVARATLTVAFDILERMNYLILSNNSEDHQAIENCLQEQIKIVESEIKSDKTLLQWLFTKTELPVDFGRCVNDARYALSKLENSA